VGIQIDTEYIDAKHTDIAEISNMIRNILVHVRLPFEPVQGKDWDATGDLWRISKSCQLL
jgi:hypothetical protein